MKFVKSLLLGSAAGLVAVAGAQAADLPAKAKAVEYVKVCDAYGAGFYFIPGTDICLRVGGYVRVDYYFANRGTQAPVYPGQNDIAVGAASQAAFAGGVAGAAARANGNVSYDRADSLTQWRGRAALDLDARTRTEYGTLRSYSRFYITTTSDAADAPTLERAFIQFAGFTFGFTQSFFDYSTGFSYNTMHVGSNRWTNVLAYTAQLGNGVSVTIAGEDGSRRRNSIHAGGGVITSNNTNSSPNDNINYADASDLQAGHALPDIVANLRVDQSWGSAQLSGAVHQLRANQSRNAALGQATLDYETDYGWAIGAGITFNLDMIGKGDQLIIQGSWTDGAIEYTGVSGNVGGARNSLGLVKGGAGAIVDLADAYVDFFGQLQTVEAWTVRADFRHFWTPTLRTSVFGGFTSVDVPFVCGDAACTTANARTATGSTGVGTLGGAGINSTARDFSIWQVGTNTIWSPVKNLDIGLEFLYSEIQVDGPKNGAGAAAAVNTQDEGIFSTTLRVQRSF